MVILYKGPDHLFFQVSSCSFLFCCVAQFEKINHNLRGETLRIPSIATKRLVLSFTGVWPSLKYLNNGFIICHISWLRCLRHTKDKSYSQLGFPEDRPQ